MKGCELCDRAARMYCESDQASLCWECDGKVHGANFLVARHPRVLLCRSCQAPTPWRASGARLSPTFSVCESCSAGGKALAAGEGDEWEGEAEGEGEMEVDEEDDYDDEVSDSEEDEEEEEEEGENQVVPWTQIPPPPASSSSGEESSWTGRAGAGFLNQMRENVDLAFQHDLDCSNFHRNHLAAAPLARSTNKERCRSHFRQANPSSVATAGADNHISRRVFHSTFDLTSSASRSPPI